MFLESNHASGCFFYQLDMSMRPVWDLRPVCGTLVQVTLNIRNVVATSLYQLCLLDMSMELSIRKFGHY